MNMMHLPVKMPDLPSYRESVDQAVSGENLRAVASSLTEPMALLGLSFLARAGDPVRKELGEMAVRAKSEYVPVVTVLSVTMDGIDAETVGGLVQGDPDNALGPYLQGTLLHVSNRASEALAAFRKAAACPELRFYDSITGEALFKALDALHLEGLDRLCALSWKTSRWADFSGAGIQPIYHALSEMARTADPATRPELAEILLTLAGHLFVTSFTNRWFAQRAVELAFMIKAELAAAASLRNGYAAAVYGLTRSMGCWPGLKEWWNKSPLELAQFLPNRIWRAFAAADPALMNAYVIGEGNANPPESERVAFEAAKERAAQAAKKLIEAALSDPDAIFGPYLKGIPPTRRPPVGGPLFSGTPVGGLIEKRPDLFRAAAANEEAMAALWKAGENDPSRKNAARMLEIVWAIIGYAQTHDLAYPDSLAVLFESGHLKPPLEAKSLATGRPYVYVAAGEKSPSKANDQARFVLLYDDNLIANGWYDCGFAAGMCGGISASDLQEQMKSRGKAGA
jgi:hypothetical protein